MDQIISNQLLTLCKVASRSRSCYIDVRPIRVYSSKKRSNHTIGAFRLLTKINFGQLGLTLPNRYTCSFRISKPSSFSVTNKNRQIRNCVTNRWEVDGNGLIEALLITCNRVSRVNDRVTIRLLLVVETGINNLTNLIDQDNCGV